ncbi:hypothetical protein GCM10018781_62800 [Kitasatospora indigofera]|uniref:Uncharacterized protein n=1 Tax=Kitasatospora indigofera TaxID=67307 RepID=A0A919GAQ0_9ACTN|nr:hypothetical protein [Kitasatospora indigofera]GHH81051.1 hypothetical protein GCM10018781_62800 [Kitasatospora indigofera]
MTIKPTNRVRTAAYLRCYPYDDWQMQAHAQALEDHARRLGLGTPRKFLDNGVSCRGVQPQLRLLLSLASVELIDTVLVPGRWVFSLDEHTANSVADFLAGAGTKVIELPRRDNGPRTPRPRRISVIESTDPAARLPYQAQP